MRKIYCLIIGIFTLLILNSKEAYAQTFDFTFSSPVRLEEVFTVNYTINDLFGNNNYRLKVRIGSENDLVAGQTLNQNTATWLKDTAAWDKFPVITTDADGLVSGQISARLTDAYNKGQYKIALAVREDSTGKEYESSTKTIDFNGALSTTQESSVGGLPETGLTDFTLWLYAIGILSIFGGTLVLRRHLLS